MPFKAKITKDYASFVSAGDTARDAHRWPEAEAAYRTALENGAPQAAFNVQLGHALKEQGKLSEAEQSYRAALASDGDNADTHVQLGHALKLAGRRAEAVEAYKRAFDLDRGGVTEAAVEYRSLTGITLDRAGTGLSVAELDEVHTLISILRRSQAAHYGIFQSLPSLEISPPKKSAH